MGHNPNQMLMGATQSNVKEVTNKKGTIEAGLLVRLKSDDTISLAKADGEVLGISLGRDMSDTGRTAICRKGLRVPVKLATDFNPTIGAPVSFSDTTGEAVGSGGTALNAVFVSGRLGGSGANGGIAEVSQEDTVGVALIDFAGGL